MTTQRNTLVQVSGLSGATPYTYDPVGNCLPKNATDYVYDPNTSQPEVLSDGLIKCARALRVTVGPE